MENINNAMFDVSHELRKPVANLMSVLTLFKTDGMHYINATQHHDLLELTLRDLDNAILRWQRKHESI